MNRFVRTLIAVVPLQGLCCGGDGTSGGTPCESLVSSLCERARACAAMDENAADRNDCTLKVPGHTTSWNCSVCASAAGRDICGDTTKTGALFMQCEAASSTAMCSITTSCIGTGCSPAPKRYGLGLPDACKDLLQCNSGPCRQ